MRTVGATIGKRCARRSHSHYSGFSADRPRAEHRLDAPDFVSGIKNQFLPHGGADCLEQRGQGRSPPELPDSRRVALACPPRRSALPTSARIRVGGVCPTCDGTTPPADRFGPCLSVGVDHPPSSAASTAGSGRSASSRHDQLKLGSQPSHEALGAILVLDSGSSR